MRDKDKGPVVSEAHREEWETPSDKPRSDWGLGRLAGSLEAGVWAVSSAVV